MPGVKAQWAADAAAAADMVVLSIPLHRFPALDPGLLAGKLVVDAMNYWAPADGVVPMFEDQELSSSEIVQRRIPLSTVVKSLNQIAYQDLEDGRRPAASADRHAIGVAGDDPGATKLVGEIIDRFGYDPYGVEYTDQGVEVNRRVFSRRGLDPAHVIHADFLSREFQDCYRGAFDVVCSPGTVVLFSANLLHGARPNTSGRPAYRTAWHYVPGDLNLEMFPRGGYEDRHIVRGY